MPKISPFRALRPLKQKMSAIVTRPLEQYSTGQARLMASESPCHFFHLISPELENQYLRGSRQELIYKKIGDHLETFLNEGWLVADEQPAIYIYQTSQDGKSHTGIWVLTPIDEYLEGHVLKHELTVERREKLLADYLQHTGLDANPVLLTYPDQPAVNKWIERFIERPAMLDFQYLDGSQHRLWKVTETEAMQELTTHFALIDKVYIADGHHRMASLAKMALHYRQAGHHRSDAAYNFFSTAYFSASEISILAFNRLISCGPDFDEAAFLAALETHFELDRCPEAYVPKAKYEWGMCLESGWFRLQAKPVLYEGRGIVDQLDVSLLQDYILEPLLGVKDARTDARLTFEGEKVAVSELAQRVRSGKDTIAFTLYPTSVNELMEVADCGATMPPKSTWIEPKFLVGFLTHLLR